MKERTKYFVVATIIATLFVLTACARNLKETKFTVQNAKLNIVIAGDSSKFKDDIRKKVIEKYKRQCNISVVNINKLKTIRLDNYDAVIIMDTYMMLSMFNRSVKKYINSLKDKGKVVLFMTTGDPDSDFSYRNVDAITSASKRQNIDNVVKDITAKIDTIIGAQIKP